MNLYPALRARMGSWTYYSVKMSVRELSENVKFAYEVFEDRTLDEAIQRILNKERVNKEIVQYLKRQPHRFFASIVVAALDGDPQFYPVEITEDPRFQVFRDDQRLNEAFGVLRFDGSQKYYALDGQHRLAAIRTLLDRNNPLSDGAPEGFDVEELSVLVVVPSREDTEEGFLQKYRRLFANLNRYAKSTDEATNVIMDEDDAFAILTRRLISDHEFFRSAGRQRESIRVKTKQGKNLNPSDSFFTQVVVLYDVNTELLSSRSRRNRGWGTDGETGEDIRGFKRFRPSDEYIDALYEELVMYWDAILEEIPDLRREPPKMRTEGLDPNEDAGEEENHLLFRPIGHLLLAALVRQLLDKRLPDPDNPEAAAVKGALAGLAKLEWRLNHSPWVHFLWVPRDPSDESGRWRMRSEERKEAVRIGQRIQQWVIGLDELDEQGIQDLKDEWSSRLVPALDEKKRDRLWSEVEERRANMAG